MQFFVTGATGFIGGHLVRQLTGAGHEVAALVRRPPSARHLADLGVDVYKGDITDKESMRNPMKDVDGVFHVAAWYKIGVRDRRPAELINVGGTRNVLELMQDLEVPKGIYTSSLAVFSDTKGKMVDETYRHDGPFLSEYDRTKWMAHFQVAEPMMKAGLPLVVVQPGLVYGPGMAGPLREPLVRYLQGKLRALPKGNAYCWGHVEDTVRGHLLAMEHGRPGESYILAGPPHTIGGAFEIAERITGIPAPSRRAAPGTLRFLAVLTSVFGRILPLSSLYHPETLRVTAGTTYLGDSGKAERELGFEARPLEVGLRETLAHEMRLLGLALPEA